MSCVHHDVNKNHGATTWRPKICNKYEYKNISEADYLQITNKCYHYQINLS
jgi:hypothetical protein